MSILVLLLLISWSQINTRKIEKLHTEEIEQLREGINGLYGKIRHEQENNVALNEKLKDISEQKKTIENEKVAISDELEEAQAELKKERAKQPTASRGAVDRTSTTPSEGSGQGRLLGTFEATAYDDSVESQGQWVGQTATGVKPQVGVIAVDPKVIPLGTKLYVEGYGNCVAADTGGAIKGNRIDVFKNTASEVRAWGRQQVKVYIRD